MRILLTGRDGQIGWELERVLAPLGDVIANDRGALDLADRDAIVRAMRNTRPDVIVNAAAYTAVDRAESEPALAARINGEAPGILAEEAQRAGGRLIHFSTDYVFDGRKNSPYVETDAPNPLSVYGKTKLQGEQAVRSTGCRHAILRTSWVYAGRGRNFLRTILQKGREGGKLRVVDDQRGTPTWARDVARLTAAVLAQAELQGTYHAAASGETTWCGFAREIFRLCAISAPLEAIATSEYPTAAVRPAYSVLDSSLLARAGAIPSVGPWQERLSSMLRGQVP